MLQLMLLMLVQPMLPSREELCAPCSSCAPCGCMAFGVQVGIAGQGSAVQLQHAADVHVGDQLEPSASAMASRLQVRLSSGECDQEIVSLLLARQFNVDKRGTRGRMYRYALRRMWEKSRPMAGFIEV